MCLGQRIQLSKQSDLHRVPEETSRPPPKARTVVTVRQQSFKEGHITIKCDDTSFDVRPAIDEHTGVIAANGQLEL